MQHFEPYLSYALALFVGLLIGLEREHSRAQSGEQGRFIGGVRTFPIFSLAAAVSASLSHPLGPWPFVLAALGMLVFTVLGHRKWDEEGSGGLTSERGWDTERATMRIITDSHGRVMVLMTHNTDIADAWEREGEDPEFFYRFSPQGYAVAINAMLYAMMY